MKQRIVWVDALNVIACFGVLLLHCTNREIHSFSGTFSVSWSEGIFSHSFFIWPVNVFFMLSGFTIMTKQLNNNLLHGGVSNFFRRRLKRLLIPVLSWNIFYMILSEFFIIKSGQGLESLTTMIARFITFDYNNIMWFFIPLTVIYLSMPFLTLFVINANRRILKQFILIAIILNCIGAIYSSIVPSHGGGGTLLNIYLFGSRYLVFPIAGYYLGNFVISSTTRKRLYGIAFACIAVIILGTAYLFQHYPTKYRFLIDYINLPCTLISFAVFCWFKYANWQRFCDKLHINSNTLAKFSGLSLGIYLIQKFWFIFLSHFSFLPQQGFITFAIMYLLCVSSVWLIKKLPIIKHTV